MNALPKRTVDVLTLREQIEECENILSNIRAGQEALLDWTQTPHEELILMKVAERGKQETIKWLEEICKESEGRDDL